MPDSLTLTPVAMVRCNCPEPAGTPIQAVYAPEQEARIEVIPSFADALLDIEGFEHLWLVTWLHRSEPGPLQLTPFRDNRPHGVFATRSPRRPNPLGLSRVRLLRVEGTTLHVAGVDIIDGTPILDIKPYIPEFDALNASRAGWFDERRDTRTTADDRFTATVECFDAEAADWDASQHRQLLAQTAVTAIREALAPAAHSRVLDVGCGTGLVGLGLADVVARVHGVDLSPGMIGQFLAKAADRGGITAEVRDLIAEPFAEACFDLVVSAMAFHHIEDSSAMLQSLHSCLATGGQIAIVDLESEDGSFHGDNEHIPHLGFAPAAFCQLLSEAGFQDASARTIHHLQTDKRAAPYPIFLATARA